MIPEDMTIDELLGFVNSLGLCSFKRRKGFFGEEIVCEKDSRKIEVRFGRFAPGVNDGARMIHFSAVDGLGGMGSPISSLEELGRYIERYATRLGLLNPQMSLF